MKILKSIFQKKRLAVVWKPDGFSFFLFEKSVGLKYESVPFDSPPKDLIAWHAKQTILVIPRSEVLQKEMLLGQPAGMKEDLEIKIAQLLPYSPKEMAYSLALDASRGLLYAIPEQKIKEMLEILGRLGVKVDEVVSEDQAIFWFFQGKGIAGPILILDQTSDRTLFLAFKDNAILLSRAYPKEEGLKNILSEISFSLLESGIKPVKAFVLGSLDRREVAASLEMEVEGLASESMEGVSIPLVLSGIKRWGNYPVISLLPSGEKIQKRNERKNQLLREVLAAFCSMVICFSLLAASHLLILKHKKMLLEKQIARLAPAVSELRQISGSLDSMHEAEVSKQRLLFLLQELAGQLPGSVRLKELQVEGRNIVFQGESPSHAFLTETVQVLEKTEGIKETKLEHARLRKRLNQDFFDFEVTAQWQN